MGSISARWPCSGDIYQAREEKANQGTFEEMPVGGSQVWGEMKLVTQDPWRRASEPRKDSGGYPPWQWGPGLDSTVLGMDAEDSSDRNSGRPRG